MKKTIVLINIDSKMPNLALAKIEKYHRDRGNTVIRDFELAASWADEVYASCIFSWNRDEAQSWQNIAHVGGSGYDVGLNLPPEIDAIKPRINLGFTTRGCPNNCGFCIVPTKEGHIRAESDIYDIWDGKAKLVTLLDNNILALRDHFLLVAKQLKKEKVRVDFNQGLDIRLVDDQIASILSSLSLKRVRFSLDSMELIPEFREKIKLLNKYMQVKGGSYVVYVLTGFDTTFDEDMERVQFLKSLGIRPFIQTYNGDKKDRIYREFKRWVNLFWPLQKYTFREWLRMRNVISDGIRI